MATCKDCLCVDVCSIADVMGEDYCCEGIKDRSKIVELPCKVGDVVYYITPDKSQIKPMLINQIFIDREEQTISDGGGTIYFLFENFGETVFLTKEEAEKALAERSKEL